MRGYESDFDDPSYIVGAVDSAFSSRIKLQRFAKCVLSGWYWIANRILEWELRIAIVSSWCSVWCCRVQLAESRIVVAYHRIILERWTGIKSRSDACANCE